MATRNKRKCEVTIPSYSSKSGRTYVTPASSLKSGGEGAIFSITGDSKHVLKIYHSKPNLREIEEKLEMMVSNQPDPSVISQIAWPVDLIYNSRKFAGFAMPNLAGKKELVTLYPYNPGDTTQISIRNKICVAQNICAVINAVHKAGYLFGDFNPVNIGVDPANGLVAFFDTDSYHVINRNTNKTYRCNVCAPGYAAPELIRHMKANPGGEYGNVPLPTFTRDTDNFALAIHMFKLLMNGFTPYNGIMENHRPFSAPSPGIDDDAVFRDSYCFKPGKKPLAAAVPSLDEIPHRLADLIQRAFIDGKKDPSKRPDAAEWHMALEDYQAQLVQCKQNPTHQYLKSLSTCPWCAADDRYDQGLQIKQKPFTAPLRPPTPPRATPGVVPPPPPGYPQPIITSTPKRTRSSGLLKTIIRLGLAAGLGLFACNAFTSIPEIVNSIILGSSSSGSSYTSNQNSGTSNLSAPANQPVDAETSQKDQPVIAGETGEILYSCKGTMPQEFRVNGKAKVTTEQDRLIVRSSPSTDYVQQFRLYTGTIVTVLSGPDCTGGTSWWYINVTKGTEVFNPVNNQNYLLPSDSEGWVRGALGEWRNDSEADHLRPVE